MSNTILNKTFKNTGEKKLLNKFDVLYILIKEKSPYNYCSMAGFTNESTRPIICQPNKVVILIENIENINKRDIDAEVH